MLSDAIMAEIAQISH